MPTSAPRPSVNHLLRPLSWLYGLGVGARNLLFDTGVLTETAFDLPVICVGNLAVGGTGKTPHADYLVRLLEDAGLRVALLSRGYKRSSHGWQLAGPRSTSADIGDEPLQIYRRHPRAIVAVDADRRHGIRRLLAMTPRPDCIVLDDAFQHRYVRAGLNILLTDYHRLFVGDALLPAGRLREPASGRRRAQIVVVTKCPARLSAVECAALRRRLRLEPGQHLFFTAMRYGTPYPLFPDEVRAGTGAATEKTSATTVFTSTTIEKTSTTTGNPDAATGGTGTAPAVSPSAPDALLAVSGIAHPEPFVRYAHTLCPRATTLAYPDHHAFSHGDLVHIDRAFAALEGRRRVVLTTEKDAARLLHAPGLTPAVRAALYVQPIEVEFLHGGEEKFNDIIYRYVRSYPRNR